MKPKFFLNVAKINTLKFKSLDIKKHREKISYRCEKVFARGITKEVLVYSYKNNILSFFMMTSPIENMKQKNEQTSHARGRAHGRQRYGNISPQH